MTGKIKQSRGGCEEGRPFPNENFFAFSSKSARFYAFLLRKTTCGQKLGPGA